MTAGQGTPDLAPEEAADLILRCAWLTVTAELLHEVDPSGQLSAQLLDLRDLLQCRDAREVA